LQPASDQGMDASHYCTVDPSGAAAQPADIVSSLRLYSAGLVGGGPDGLLRSIECFDWQAQVPGLPVDVTICTSSMRSLDAGNASTSPLLTQDSWCEGRHGHATLAV
jgi:hypothetical protein